ncbi:MAG: hypothetical protein QOF48_2328 [Verrucomicrobiota bacterium]|jgi:hypothetical protein
MQNLSELLRRLIETNVEFVLVGGFAAVAHGVTLVTRDLDVCCRFSEKNLMRVQNALADLHPVHRSRPDMPLQLTPEQCAVLKNLYLKTDLGAVDCLGHVLAVGGFDQVEKHVIELDLPCGKCRVLDLDTLILAKEAVGRDHDLITIKHLKAIKNQQHQK